MVSGHMDRISLEIPFARLDDRAVLPTQGSAQAAGWDLYAIEDTVVPKGASVLIPTGWAAAIPKDGKDRFVVAPRWARRA